MVRVEEREAVEPGKKEGGEVVKGVEVAAFEAQTWTVSWCSTRTPRVLYSIPTRGRGEARKEKG
jgi:hypothetical protein